MIDYLTKRPDKLTEYVAQIYLLKFIYKIYLLNRSPYDLNRFYYT
jgi:hypothetical protein